MAKVIKQSRNGKLLFLLLTVFHTIWCEDTGKVGSMLMSTLDQGKMPNVIVNLGSPNSQTGDPLSKISQAMFTSTSKSKQDKTRLLAELLQTAAFSAVHQSLADSINMLNAKQAQYSVLWMTNQITVYQASKDDVFKLASMASVKSVRLDHEVLVNPGIINSNMSSITDTDSIEKVSLNSVLSEDDDNNPFYNIDLIRARCKDISCLGTGVTVGFIDTGVLWDHDELKDNWVGPPFGWWNGTNATTNSPFPDDIDGRGTFVAGVAVGKNVGVASGAKWMACQACPTDSSSCTQDGLLNCAHFMTCPWQWNDNTPDKVTKDCSKRPDIIIYSGGSQIGGQLFDPAYMYYYPWIKLWNEIGIMSVFAMGDGGPDCNSGYSLGNFDISLGVGAVDETVSVADLSSRGPTIINKPLTKRSTASGTCPAGLKNYCTGVNKEDHVCLLIKPDIVAPGVDIISSYVFNEGDGDTDSYAIASSTAYGAAPHVVGVIALMMCANPEVPWNYKRVYHILTETADRKRIDLKSGNEDSSEMFPATSHLFCDVMFSGICEGFPNNLYGWGLVDACSAVKAARSLKPNHY